MGLTSALTYKQFRQFGPKSISGYGTNGRMLVTIRYDDECKNGHNTFAITSDITTNESRRIRDIAAGGCLHDEIKVLFPELAQYIKWHLCSSDGPMHYIANTIYWANKGNLEYARSSAIWPDATLEQLKDKDALTERLPALLNEFKSAVESLGFTF
jgi:hypothetical protein